MRSNFIATNLALLFLSGVAHSQMNPAKVELETLPSKKSTQGTTHLPTVNSPPTAPGVPVKKHRKPTSVSESESSTGNLPSYARRAEQVEQVRSPSITPKNSDFDGLVDLKKGDVLRAVIQKNLAAYPGSKAPISARVIDGKFKGAFLFGQASLDETTKRANIVFSSIRPIHSATAYSFTGELTSADGIMGLDGEYETSYWTYLIAEAATNMVSGFARGATPYSQTEFGNYVQQPGIKTQTTTAIAEGLASTAERIGNRTKNAPEITTVQGPVIVDIIVTK